MLARLGERDRDALAAGPPRPADAVDVDLGRGRHVVVHDVREVRDVEPPRRDVRRDDELERARAELLHHAVALLLRDPAVERLDAHAAALQALGQVVHLEARAAEDERGRGALEVEDAAERGALVAARDDVGGLAHLRQLAGRGGLPGDRDAHGVLQVLRRDRPDARRQRRREERRLARLRRRREDRVEVLGEPHVEHLVRLVEDERPQAVEGSDLRFTWSSARPGVATTTSTPRLRAWSCVSIDAPP